MSVPVEIEGVVTVVGKTVLVGPFQPAGIVTGAAYADLDNIGQLFFSCSTGVGDHPVCRVPRP